ADGQPAPRRLVGRAGPRRTLRGRGALRARRLVPMAAAGRAPDRCTAGWRGARGRCRLARTRLSGIPSHAPLSAAGRPSITAFFLCHNDAGTIPSMVIVADRTLRELTDDYEIVVGNDASTDRSSELLAELQQLYPRLRVLNHPRNLGYGGNLRTGFAAAT